MRRCLLLVILFAVLTVFSCCTPSTPNTPPSTQAKLDFDFSDKAIASNKDFYKNYSLSEKNLYYDLWKETTKICIKIDISPYELAKINEAFQSRDDVKTDTYRKCNLEITVNGIDYKFDDVGIRMHGNTSRREFCDENGNIYSFVHFRFNLTETFDGEKYAAGAWGHDIEQKWTNTAARDKRKNRSFATLGKFFVKWNKNYDNTYVREIYANNAFRSSGILAPHITLSQIQLKQQGSFENLGVMMLYETVDKQFVKRSFAAELSGGDLYKCAYQTGPANLTTADGRGVDAPGQRFNYSLKTNNDRTAPEYTHHKYLIALIDMLKTPKNDADFRAKLEAIVEMNYFSTFEAVNYLLGNPDCIRNNANNYYMYFLPQSGKMYLIPYDYDRCLGINVDWNGFGNSMTGQTPYSTKSAAGETENPLYTKTILEGGAEYYQNMFKEKLQTALADSWFTYDNFKKVFESYKQNYESLVTPSQIIRSRCGQNVRMNMLEMSERGTTDLSSNSDNITTQLYMQLKRDCANSNLTAPN